MAIMRWNPTPDLMDFQSELNRTFNRFLGGDPWETTMARSAWDPAVDITENDESFAVTAELPGMNKDDVKISYEDGVLTIRGDKKQEKEEKNKNFHRVERSYGAFERSFRLPTHIVVDKIQARFKDGVLHLLLPKAEEAKPKEIPIKIS